MTTMMRKMLRDADPVRREPHPPEGERDRIRRAAVAAARERRAGRSGPLHERRLVVAIVPLLLAAIAAIGFQTWSEGGRILQAAIRFEVRLAEERPAAGLREARVMGSERLIYLHQEPVVTNEDIERSSVVAGDGPSRFGVSVEFSAGGAEKMRKATAGHIGRPAAILIDGVVVAAPVVRTPISTLATISGGYTRAEAERIVDGIGRR